MLKLINGRMLSSETIQIRAGYKNYYPHKALICKIAPFFPKKFGDQLALPAGLVILSGVDSEVFELFLSWLYKGEAGLENGKKDVAVYIKLYLLASAWILPDLMDSILSILNDEFQARDQEQPIELLVSIKNILQSREFVMNTLLELNDCLVKLILATIENCKRVGDQWEDTFSSILEAHPPFAAKIAIAYAKQPSSTIVQNKDSEHKRRSAKSFYERLAYKQSLRDKYGRRNV